jgi:nitrogenase subunit NifH
MEHAATTINRMQAENKDIREECKVNYLIQADKAREVENEAVKEFAEMVKEETLAIVFSPDVVSAADYIKCIDKLVEKWLVMNNG